MLQAPAFTGLPRPWFAHAAVCSAAAVGDSLLVLALYLLGSASSAGRDGFAHLALAAT
jgi:hypothetical protein